jgi:hypothetical protein
VGSIYNRDSVQVSIPITATVAGTDATQAATAIVPVKGSVTNVRFIPSAAVAANATNYTVLTVQNKGTNGLSGTTSVASRSWAAGNSTTSQPDALAITNLANAQVAAGDVLQVVSTHGGAGVAVPAGVMVVFITPRH